MLGSPAPTISHWVAGVPGLVFSQAMGLVIGASHGLAATATASGAEKGACGRSKTSSPRIMAADEATYLRPFSIARRSSCRSPQQRDSDVADGYSASAPSDTADQIREK